MKKFSVKDLLLVPALNVTRNGKAFTNETDRKTLATSFVADGWTEFGKSAIVCPVDNISAEYIELGMSYRKDLKELVKGFEAKIEDVNITLPDSDYIAMAEKMFPEDGTPKYVVIDANRRIESLILANCLRKFLEKPEILKVPCVVENVENMSEFYTLNAMANKPEVGKREVGMIDLLRTAKVIHDNMGNQAQVRKAMKAGTGQKMWSIVYLDNRLEVLGLYDKCLENPEYLTSLAKDKVTKFQSRVKNSHTISEELRAEITEYFNDPKAGKQKQKKMLPQTEVETLTQSPNKVVQEIANGIINRNKDSIIALNDKAELMNMVLENRIIISDDKIIILDHENETSKVYLNEDTLDLG